MTVTSFVVPARKCVLESYYQTVVRFQEEAILAYLGTQQPEPLGLVKAEHADLKQTDEQKVNKQR
jgi:hypothetical protein